MTSVSLPHARSDWLGAWACRDRAPRDGGVSGFQTTSRAGLSCCRRSASFGECVATSRLLVSAPAHFELVHLGFFRWLGPRQSTLVGQTRHDPPKTFSSPPATGRSTEPSPARGRLRMAGARRTGTRSARPHSRQATLVEQQPLVESLLRQLEYDARPLRPAGPARRKQRSLRTQLGMPADLWA
jgi:hypothetical protein